MKEIVKTYAGINQSEFKYQTVFSSSIDKYDGDGQVEEVVEEIELYFNLNFNQFLTQSDIDKFNVNFQLEQQIQNQRSKGSGWRFDKII